MKHDVYWNFRRKIWSIRQSGSQKVIDHRTSLIMDNSDAVARVSRAGTARVRREKRKNVHAYIRGEIVHPSDILNYTPCLQISYNPYTDDSFKIQSGGFYGHSYENKFKFECMRFYHVDYLFFDLFGKVWTLE